MKLGRAGKITITIALVATAILLLPSTLHTIHLGGVANRLVENRASYEKAVEWALRQEREGWSNLPGEFKSLSASRSVLMLGEPGQRIVCFDVEDDGDLVRFIAYVEPPNAEIDSLALVTEEKYAFWTERHLDKHWQIMLALP